MKILAIESSCDETAAAVVENGRTILSSVVNSQIDIHRRYGGVVPEIASRAHTEALTQVTQDALTQAGLSLDGLDALAVTYTPGLVGALLAGGLVSILTPLLPFILSFAAGTMAGVTVCELIPEAVSHKEGVPGTVGACFGFALMMALDMAL